MNIGIIASAGNNVVNPADYNPAAWYRHTIGITLVSGGVSVWANQSGIAGRDLAQSSAAARPTVDVDGAILFDGVDDFLLTPAFPLSQPTTRYILYKPVSWTFSDTIFDGSVDPNSAAMFQGNDGGAGESPNIALYAGSYGPQNLANATLGSFHAIAAVNNGASSSLKVDTNAKTTGDVGSTNAQGFTLGGRYQLGGISDRNSHIAVKEVIIYASAHDDATQTDIINYLLSL